MADLNDIEQILRKSKSDDERWEALADLVAHMRGPEISNEPPRPGYSLGTFAASRSDVLDAMEAEFKRQKLPKSEHKVFAAAVSELEAYIDDTFPRWPGGLALSVSWYEARKGDEGPPYHVQASLQEFAVPQVTPVTTDTDWQEAVANAKSFAEFKKLVGA